MSLRETVPAALSVCSRSDTAASLYVHAILVSASRSISAGRRNGHNPQLRAKSALPLIPLGPLRRPNHDPAVDNPGRSGRERKWISAPIST